MPFVDLTGAVMAGLLTEPSHTVVVAGPAVVAGLQTEPPGTSAVAGLQTEPPHAVAASGLPTEPLTVGSTIFVDLLEHGVSADFTVREIRPCPTPMAGDGYLVTTKFIHQNAEILNLRIEGSSEPIGTTASHPFWSEDRQQFVTAGDLRVGENLLLADDTTRKLESLTRRETRETVYNIEVDGEHVFYVGDDGVLVHNSCHTRANHVYQIIDNRTGQVFKYGISSQRIGRHGSYRAVRQVNRLNLINPGRYRHEIIARNVTRAKAFAIEQGRVTAFARAKDALNGRNMAVPFKDLGPDGNLSPLGGTAWIGCVAKQQEAPACKWNFHGMLASG